MDNEYQSPFCGRTISVVNTGSSDGGVHGKGNTITALVQDTCESCQNDNLDFSIGAWNALTSNSEESVVDVTWYVAFVALPGLGMGLRADYDLLMRWIGTLTLREALREERW